MLTVPDHTASFSRLTWHSLCFRSPRKPSIHRAPAVGIARCDRDLFLCNDDSISESKRSCTSYLGNSRTTPDQTAPSLCRLADSFSERACAISPFCAGPHGRVYCLTPMGGRVMCESKNFNYQEETY